MDAEQFRSMARALPYVEETRQWGENLVFWVGDKAVGGKMFALLDLKDRVRADDSAAPLASFCAGAERFASLVEREGVIPAPYLARAHWVALERWDALGARELEELLQRAHTQVYERLTKRAHAALALPRAAYHQAIAAAKAGS